MGVQVKIDASKIKISQARKILDKFGSSDAHAVRNPLETRRKLSALTTDGDTEMGRSFDYRGALGLLMYLVTCTQPDLAYTVGQLSRFVAQPSNQHVGCLKRVLRCLVGTSDYGIEYKRDTHIDPPMIIQGHCDSDWLPIRETERALVDSFLRWHEVQSLGRARSSL